MVQKTRKTLGFMKIMVYKITPGGEGKPYLATGLVVLSESCDKVLRVPCLTIDGQN